MAKKIPYAFDYVNGVTYTTTQYLQPGTHPYFFTCQAGSASNSTTSGSLVVSVSNSQAPVLNTPSVNREWGYENATTFTFGINFTDADNNAPASINVTVNSTIVPMTKVNASDTRFNDGCLYQGSIVLVQRGTYTYTFDASDGTFTGSLGPISGITVVSKSYIDETFESLATGQLHDDFETYTTGLNLNGINSWTDVTVAPATSTVQVESGTKKLDQYDTSTTGYSDSRWTLPAGYSTTGWNSITFDVKKSATTGRSQAWIFDLAGTLLFEVNFENDGFIRINGGAATLQTYAANVNYHVSMFFNLATDRCYVIINSTTYNNTGSAYTFYSGATSTNVN
nr:hypothetical protein [Candidatus Sigynarchaeota archaeon]